MKKLIANWKLKLFYYALHCVKYALSKKYRDKQLRLSMNFSNAISESSPNRENSIKIGLLVNSIFIRKSVFYIVTKRPGIIIGKGGRTIDPILFLLKNSQKDENLSIEFVEFGYSFSFPYEY